MRTHKAALRKAAILIAALDQQTANDLLDQMGSEEAARVRQEIMDLGTVDPDEQNDVIQEFFRKGPMPKSKNSGGVELELSSDSYSTVESTRSSTPTLTAERTPFRFLHDAEFAALAPVLEREHPQTIAVVAGHLPPARAAELLSSLSPELQVDVLRRLTDLDETDPEIVRDIEQGLEKWVADQTRTQQRRQAGRKAVAAILQAAQTQQHYGLLANLNQSGRSGSKKPTTAEPLEPKPAVEKSDPPVQTETAFVFDDLSQLSDAALLTVFQSSSSELTTLALAGASPELVDRITRRLTPRAARELRSALSQLGPTRLSDIEHAKDEISRVAGQLERQGRIELLRRRSLSVAL